MLFDLEDYRVSGITGKDHVHVHQIRWDDSMYTQRATFDTYYNTIREYGAAAVTMAPASEVSTILEKSFIALEKLSSFRKISKEFWNAMCSIAIVGSYNEGDRFDYTTVNMDVVVDGVDYQDLTWTDLKRIMNPYKFVAFRNENGEFEYRSMTQVLYNSYYTALTDAQSAVKTLMLTGEGVSTIAEFVPPLVPVWNDTAELSGYVRDSRSLPISGATVRLVDVDGVNHDLVTDELGYYHFTKEYIYNNISFGTASSVEFDMFILEETTGGIVLYDQTSIFQNSFFGAVNNRDFTWPVLVKSGKPNRRNFKIQFITDYSNYPSFSGYVKDNDGNPIKDAFVMIRDGNTGYCIGNYKKSNGDIAMNYKYNDFGVDRTILTDANGFYEYTSQMVGEWFNKEFMQVGEVAGNLGGRIFDDYFGSREDLISFYDSFTERNLQYKESFAPIINPYKQDANSNSIVSEGASLYDINDYYTSRFKYALTSYNEFQYQRIDLNAHYDIDVDVTVATNDEFRANKFTVELETNNRYAGYGMSQEFYCTSTTGYVKIVYPATGESYIFNGGNYYSSWHISINSNNIEDYKNYYVYACDSTGKAMGYIRNVQSGQFTKTIDLSELKYLNIFETYGPFYGESIDFSGLNYLSRVVISLAHLLKNIIGLNSKKLDFFSLQGLDLIENIDISELTNLTYLNLKYLPLLESLDIQNNTKLNTLYIDYVDITLDVTGLTNLNTFQYNKLTMTSDDVDDLLIQLASTDLIGSGNVSIDRISRSSYSDDAFNTLMSKSWNINLGSYFYDEEIIPNKLVLTIDPTRVVNEMINYGSYGITTTTGYWIGKLWSGELIGNTNFVGSSINHRLAFSDDDANLEIYSCNEYGVPQGEITEVNLYQSDFKNIDTSELVALERFVTVYSRASIESLDFTYNYNLVYLTVENNNTLQSINVSGLTSLEELNLNFCQNLVNVTGFSTLSSLIQLRLSGLSGLDYLSLEGINTIRLIEIDNLDLYDSTHVDTILAELKTISTNVVSELNASVVVKQAERDVKLAELSAFDTQEPTISTLASQLDTLYTELNQLISDGADQSLIDSKQVEVNTKSAELSAKEVDRKLISNQVDTLDSEISDLNSQISNTFANVANLNTFYMARTSASDADYDSLLTYGWNLQLGSEFVSPYTEPVKGFFTYDWTAEQDSSDNIFIGNQTLKLSSSTGFVKYVSGRYSGVLSVSTDYSNLSDFYNHIVKGVTEFWSCDSHGRASGSITGFGHGQNFNDYMKSFNISNLTEIKNIYLYGIKLSSIDLSSNINIESINIGETYNKLESIVGFENLVNLKDIYISNSVSKLDIPVDFTSMPNLQRIKLWELGINKNSRLNISGLTKLQSVGLSWTNILSVDLDNALLALDAAGLDSEFDFNYEGHLNELGNELKLNIGMGIDHHTIADAAFTSLESKGWSLNTGDQIIDSIEDPTKGIVRWGVDTSWVSLGFQLINNRSIMVTYPDGNTQIVGGQISWSFASDFPVEDRFIEFWEVDSYGRPRNGGLYRIYDDWNTHITSLEINNLIGVEVVSIPQNNATELNFTGMNKLYEVNVVNSSLLETIIFDGCSKIRTVHLSNCTQLDIDQVLVSIDSTGSVKDDLIGPNTIFAEQLQRTNASNVASDSLSDKGWSLNLIEPAGNTVILNVTAGQYVQTGVATSGGAVQFIFPVGTDMYNNYPNGYILGGCKYRGVYDYSETSLSIYMQFTGQILIKSISEYEYYNNGVIKNSGEVKYLSIHDGGNLVTSTLSKLKFLKIASEASYNWFKQNMTSLAGINLSMLRLEWGNNTTNTSLNLSTFNTKGLYITGEYTQIVLGNALTDLELVSLPNLTNISLTDNIKKILINSTAIVSIPSWPTVLTKLNLYSSPISEISNLPDSLREILLVGLNELSVIDLPNGLVDINISQCPLLNTPLDLSSIVNLRFLTLSELIFISLDITGLEKLESINMNSLFQSNVSGSSSTNIIGLETTKVRNMSVSSVKNPNFVIPTTMQQFNLTHIAPETETISVIVYGNTFINAYVAIRPYGNLNSLTSLVLPTVESLNWSNTNYFDGSSISDSRVNLNLSQITKTSLDFTGFNGGGLVITWSSQVTSITGLPSNMRFINIEYMNLSNIDLSESTFSEHVQLISLSNISISGINSQYVYMNSCANISLSDSNFHYMQSYSTYGSIDISNVNCTGQLRLWWGQIVHINLNDSNFANVNLAYLNGYNNQNWSISMNNITIQQLDMYDNPKLNTFSTSGSSSSIKRYQIGWNQNLKNVSVSFRDTNYFYSYNNLDSLVISDANLSGSSLNYVGAFRQTGTNTSQFIDSFIDAVSPTGASNGQLRATSLNSRTSASNVAFNKLVSQGWSMMSV